MEIEIPDRLANFLYWLTDQKFPGASAEKMRRLARELKTAADLVEAAEPKLAGAVRRVQEGVGGETQRAFVASMQDYVRTPGYVSNTAAHLHNVSATTENAAMRTQYQKFSILGATVQMFIEFVWAFAAAFINPGMAMAWLAARIAIFRFVIRLLFSRLMLAALGAVATEALTEALMDAIIQRIQMRLGTRRTFDQAQFWQAVRDGTIAGLVVAVLGPAFGNIGTLLNRVPVRPRQLSDGPTPPVPTPRPTPKPVPAPPPPRPTPIPGPVPPPPPVPVPVGRDVPVRAGTAPPTRLQQVRQHTGEFVTEVAASVAIEVIAGGTVSAANGQGFSVSAAAATSGAISGTLDSGAGSAGTALHDRFYPNHPSPDRKRDDASPATVDATAVDTAAEPTALPDTARPVDPTSTTGADATPNRTASGIVPGTGTGTGAGAGTGTGVGAGTGTGVGAGTGTGVGAGTGTAAGTATGTGDNAAGGDRGQPGATAGEAAPGRSASDTATQSDTSPYADSPFDDPRSARQTFDDIDFSDTSSLSDFSDTSSVRDLLDAASGPDAFDGGPRWDDTDRTTGDDGALGSNRSGDPASGVDTGRADAEQARADAPTPATPLAPVTFASVGQAGGPPTSGTPTSAGQPAGSTATAPGTAGHSPGGTATGPGGTASQNAGDASTGPGTEKTAPGTAGTGPDRVAPGEYAQVPQPLAPADIGTPATPGTVPATGGAPDRVPPWDRAVAADPAARMSVLDDWLRQREQRPGATGDPGLDCVPLAWDVFAKVHGRRSNPGPRTGLAGAGLVDAGRRGPSVADTAELLRLLGGDTATSNDGARVLAYLADKPGAMALVVARPQRDRAHVYWVVADGRGPTVTLRWVDPQQPDSFDHDVRVDGPHTTFWSGQLRSPESEILVLGPDGRAVDIGGERSDVQARGLLDAPVGPVAAGMLPRQQKEHPPGDAPVEGPEGIARSATATPLREHVSDPAPSARATRPVPVGSPGGRSRPLPDSPPRPPTRLSGLFSRPQTPGQPAPDSPPTGPNSPPDSPRSRLTRRLALEAPAQETQQSVLQRFRRSLHLVVEQASEREGDVSGPPPEGSGSPTTAGSSPVTAARPRQDKGKGRVPWAQRGAETAEPAADDLPIRDDDFDEAEISKAIRLSRVAHRRAGTGAASGSGTGGGGPTIPPEPPPARPLPPLGQPSAARHATGAGSPRTGVGRPPDPATFDVGAVERDLRSSLTGAERRMIERTVARARARAMTVSRAVGRAVHDLNSASRYGLRLAEPAEATKSPHRLAQQYAELRQREDISLERFLTQNEDTVRFSVLAPADRHEMLLFEVLSALRRLGHNTVDDDDGIFDHWRPGNTRFGATIPMRGPDGRPWELQIHTEQSWRSVQLTREFHRVNRLASAPLSARVSAVLSMLRINDELGLNRARTLFPDPVNNGLATLVDSDAGPWQQYLDGLLVAGRTFADVVAEHGLSLATLVDRERLHLPPDSPHRSETPLPPPATAPAEHATHAGPRRGGRAFDARRVERELIQSLAPADQEALFDAAQVAKERADQTLTVMRRVTDAVRASGIDVTLVGVRHRAKTVSSLARKFRDRNLREHIDLATFLATNKDSVRFSVRVPSVGYSSAVHTVLARLEAEGYERRDDADMVPFWWPGGRWFGLTTTLRYRGRLIEVEFPTAASWRTAKQARRFHEVVRLKTAPMPERVSAYLSLLRLNRDNGLNRDLPHPLTGLPKSREKGLAELVRVRGNEWRSYLGGLERADRSFLDVVLDHGLTLADLPSPAELGLPDNSHHLTVRSTRRRPETADTLGALPLLMSVLTGPRPQTDRGGGSPANRARSLSRDPAARRPAEAAPAIRPEEPERSRADTADKQPLTVTAQPPPPVAPPAPATPPPVAPPPTAAPATVASPPVAPPPTAPPAPATPPERQPSPEPPEDERGLGDDLSDDDRRVLEEGVRAARARANEALPIMRDALRVIDPGGQRAHLVGTGNRTKSLASLARKYQMRRITTGLTAEAFLAGNQDGARFAVQVSPVGYAATVREVLAELARRDYTVRGDEDVKNFWVPGNDWCGLRVIVRNRQGDPLEVQFPTESSWRTATITHPFYEVARRGTAPMSERVDAFLEMLRIQRDHGRPLPTDLDGLPSGRSRSFARFIDRSPGLWQTYLGQLERAGQTLSDVVVAHGLSMTEIFTAEERERYDTGPARISRGDTTGGADADGTDRGTALAGSAPGGDLARAAASVGPRTGGSGAAAVRPNRAEPVGESAGGGADRAGSPGLRATDGGGTPPDLPAGRSGSIADRPAPTEEPTPPPDPIRLPFRRPAGSSTPVEPERLRTEDRALLLGDGNHLLAAVLYGELDNVDEQAFQNEVVRADLTRLRDERAQQRRVISTTALTDVVADLHDLLVPRIAQLTAAQLAEIRAATAVVPAGDDAALRATLADLLRPDTPHDQPDVGPMLVAVLLGRPVVVDDGTRARSFSPAGATGVPIRLYRHAQAGTGHAAFHAYVAPPPAPPAPAATPTMPVAPPAEPVAPAAVNDPPVALRFVPGRHETLADDGVDLDELAGSIADRVVRTAAHRPPEGAPVIVTIEGHGDGPPRLLGRSPAGLGRRRAQWLAGTLEQRVRQELSRATGGDPPIVLFRHRPAATASDRDRGGRFRRTLRRLAAGGRPTPGGGAPHVGTVTVHVAIADSWDSHRRAVDPPPPPARAAVPVGGGQLDPIAYAAGIPAHALPDLDRLTGRLIRYARQHGVPEDATARDRIRGVLGNNYRHLVGDGMVVFIGNVEVRVRLELTDPRQEFAPGPTTAARTGAGAGRPDGEPGPPPAPAGRAAQVRATETIHGTFQVGAHSESHSGPISWFRFGGSPGFAFGVPHLLLSVRIGAAVRFVRNLVNRSTGTVRDAEVGRVEDTREDAALLSAAARYHLQVRHQATQSWADLPTSTLDAAERLTLALPEKYLERAEPGRADRLAATIRPNARAPLGADRRLPKVFYASGLTSLHLLADDIVRQLERERGPIPLGHPLRSDVWHRVSNLDTHLDKAVNRYRGYAFTVVENGRVVADVRIRTRRIGHGRPVSAPSDKAHVEEVRTAISGTTAGSSVTNEASIEPSLEFLVARVPKLRFAVKLPYARWSWTNRNGNSAGRLGLWVLVSRYASFTSAYQLEFAHQATVQVRRRRNVLVRAGSAVRGRRPRTRHDHPGATYQPLEIRGRAMVRVPTADAVAYGIEPPSKPGATPTPEASPAVADAAPPTVPEHARRGRGIGKGIVEVDPQLVDRLVDRVERELARFGYVVRDPDAAFERRSWFSRKRDSQVNNGVLLRKLISTAALESNFDGVHQGGFSITVRKRHTGWFTTFGVRSARVTIEARPREVQDKRGLTVPVDPTSDPRRTSERHIVNLEMGLDSGGSSAGGGQGFAAGTKLRFLPTKTGRQLQGAGIGVEWDRGVGGDESVNQVSNMPRLMEYQGELTEFEVTTQYGVVIEHDRQWSWKQLVKRVLGRSVDTRRLPTPLPPIPSTATVRVVPAFNTKPAHSPERAATGRKDTPVAVLDNAAVSYLDVTGLLTTARGRMQRMAKPGGTADEEISTFLNHAQVLSHFPEVARGRYTTDTFFTSKFWRDKHRAVSLKADLGASQFVGATSDPYVLGLIKLSLTQAGQSSSRRRGVAVTPLDLGAGGDPGRSNVTGVSASLTHAMRWGRSRSRSTKQTGGRESLELNFQRAYAFRAKVRYDLRIGKTKRAKLLPNSNYPPVARPITDVEPMIYLLSEPDALEHYARGDVPLDDEQLLDIVARWVGGDLKVSHQLMARVLIQWERTAAAEDEPDRHHDLRTDAARELARSHAWTDLAMSPEVIGEFEPLFDTTVVPTAAATRKLGLPPYLRPGPGASLGHSGIHSLTLSDGTPLSDVVIDAVDQFEPGLLGKTHDRLVPPPDTTPRRPWWRRRAQVSPYVGRLQGGLDAIQALFDGGRDQPLLEQVLSPDGVSLYFANPHGWFGQDMVEVRVSATLTSRPEFGDYVRGSGLETYRHRYVERRAATDRQFTRGTSAGLKPTFEHRPDTPPTLEEQRRSAQQRVTTGPGVRFADGVSRSRATTEQFTYESTTYDWGNYYRATADVEFTVEVRRLKLGGRRVTNWLTSKVLSRFRGGARPPLSPAASRSWVARTLGRFRRTERFLPPRTVRGSVVLKVPKSVAEATPAAAPTGLRSDVNPTALPKDAFVDSVQVHGAEAASRRLLGALFERPVKWNRWVPSRWVTRPGYHTSASVRALVTRDLLAALTPEAMSPDGVQVAADAFVPGHSSRRADLTLRCRLENMEIVSELDGTGTGRYAKYQQGFSASTTHDTPYLAAGLSAGGPAKLSVTDGSNPSEAYGAHRTEGDTDLSRQAPKSHTSTFADAHRREEHVKQQGPTVLVRMYGRYRLEGHKHIVHWWRPTSWGRRRISDEFSGDVYVQMSRADYDALVAEQRRAEFGRRSDPAGRDRTRPPVAGPQSPSLDLVDAFARLDPDGATPAPDGPDLALLGLARDLGGPVGVDAEDVLVVEVDTAGQARQLRESVDGWAAGHLTPAQIAAVHEADPAGRDLVTRMVDAVHAAAQAGARPEPPLHIRLLDDPLRAARALARALRVPVELRRRDPAGGVTDRFGVAPDGWYVELEPTIGSRRAVAAELAVDTLPPHLIDSAVRLGVTRDELVELARRPEGQFPAEAERFLRERERAARPPASPPLSAEQDGALTAHGLVPLAPESGPDSWFRALSATARRQPDPTAEVRQVAAATTAAELRTLIARRQGLPDDAPPPPLATVPAVLGVEVQTIAADGTVTSSGPTTGRPLVLAEVGGNEFRPTGPVATPVVKLRRRRPVTFLSPERAASDEPGGDTTVTTPVARRHSTPISRTLTEVAPEDRTVPNHVPAARNPATTEPAPPALSQHRTRRIALDDRLVEITSRLREHISGQSDARVRQERTAEVDGLTEAGTDSRLADTAQLVQTLTELLATYQRTDAERQSVLRLRQRHPVDPPPASGDDSGGPRVRSDAEVRLRHYLATNDPDGARLRHLEDLLTTGSDERMLDNLIAARLEHYEREDTDLAAAPAWWHEGSRNRPGEFYAPRAHQQRWLRANGLQVGWVPDDGNCVFAATLRTVGTDRVTEAARLVALAAGLPGAVRVDDPLALRAFLAAVLRRSLEQQHIRDTLRLAEAAIHPAAHDIARTGQALLTIEDLATSMATPGEYDNDQGDHYWLVVTQVLRWATDLSTARGGDLRVDLQGLSEGTVEAVLSGGGGTTPTHVIVLVNQHFLPTRRRPLAGGRDVTVLPAEVAWDLPLPRTGKGSPVGLARLRSEVETAAHRVPALDKRVRIAVADRGTAGEDAWASWRSFVDGVAALHARIDGVTERTLPATRTEFGNLLLTYQLAHRRLADLGTELPGSRQLIAPIDGPRDGVPVAPGVRRPRRRGEPEGLLGGATGLEVEFAGLALTFPVLPAPKTTLFHLADLLAVTYDTNRRSFILEVVTAPTGVLPGEENRARRDEVLDALDAVNAALASVSGPTLLSDLFPPEHGFAHHVQGVSIRPRPDEPHTRYVQFTVGAPMHALVAPLEFIAAGTYNENSRRHLLDGLDFSQVVTTSYLTQVLGSPVPPFALPFLTDVPGTEELRGYLALLYTQVVAMLHQRVAPPRSRLISKNYLAAGLRTSVSGLRAQLPPRVQSFLHEQRDRITEILLAGFTDRVAHSLHADALLDTSLRNPAAGSVRDYLRNALSPTGAGNMPISQKDAVSISGSFAMDDNDGALPTPLAVVEVRHMGDVTMDESQLHRHLKSFDHLIRAGYEREAADWNRPSALRARVLVAVRRSQAGLAVPASVGRLRTALIDTPALAADWLTSDARHPEARLADADGVLLLELVAAAMAGADVRPLLEPALAVALRYARTLNLARQRVLDRHAEILVNARDQWIEVVRALHEHRFPGGPVPDLAALTADDPSDDQMSDDYLSDDTTSDDTMSADDEATDDDTMSADDEATDDATDPSHADPGPEGPGTPAGDEPAATPGTRSAGSRSLEHTDPLHPPGRSAEPSATSAETRTAPAEPPTTRADITAALAGAPVVHPVTAPRSGTAPAARPAAPPPVARPRPTLSRSLTRAARDEYEAVLASLREHIAGNRRAETRSRTLETYTTAGMDGGVTEIRELTAVLRHLLDRYRAEDLGPAEAPISPGDENTAGAEDPQGTAGRSATPYPDDGGT
ncbi:hypothetical protein [Micromonospora sp. DT227]|uniref:WXG100-like domain-containing protein n=1 Tax=Micromonospora sp. DT227 TaxID=3393433 RepID=UPI003CF51C8F